MAKTNIAYVTHSVNPLHAIGGGWACTKVSPGCRNCYSEKRNMNPFYRGNLIPYDNSPKKFELDLRCFDRLPKRKPSRVFVQDMSDLFHPDVSLNDVNQIFQCMNNSIHTFLILTKHPETLKAYIDLYHKSFAECFPNVWLGTTVENSDYLWRIEELLRIPAAVHWVSIEPMLGQIVLRAVPDMRFKDRPLINTLTGDVYNDEMGAFADSNCLSWVVLGAESGTKRRPCKLEWMIDVVKQCKEAGVPVFVKQINQEYKIGQNTLRGKVEKDISKFPPELQIRELPE